jgi:hypothetical protein
MDREFAFSRLYFATPSDLQHRLPPSARPTHWAADGHIKGTSAGGLLVLSLGVWAAIWAALASVSSWLR